MVLPILMNGLFHTGYAVNNIHKATENLGTKFGIANWKIVPLPEETGGRALGFANSRDMMIELIDIVPGCVPIYNDWVPEQEGAIRFHHLGHMVPNREKFDSVTRQLEAADAPVVIDDELGDILYYRYFDTVAQLGHYTEFVLMKPDGNEFWKDVPRN